MEGGDGGREWRGDGGRESREGRGREGSRLKLHKEVRFK